MAGAAVITAVMMASCSDVVDIPQHDPYASNGAPVIEAIYDAQDASATPQVITGGVLNQMIVYRWFKEYDVDAHIEEIRKTNGI